MILEFKKRLEHRVVDLGFVIFDADAKRVRGLGHCVQSDEIALVVHRRTRDRGSLNRSPAFAWRRNIPGKVLVGMGLAICGTISSAMAQVDGSVYSPTSTTDLYGNVSPLDLERRSLDVFQNPVQRERLSVYQEYARQLNRRGAASPFGLSGDPRGLLFGQEGGLRGVFPTRPGAAYGGYSMGGVGPLSPTQRRALAAYGGFGKRRPLTQPGDASGVLARRQALIAATAINAPVYRALLDPGVPRMPDARLPMAGPAPPEDLESRSAVTLTQRLQFGAERSFRESLAQAWDHFSAGRYRLAIRYFQAASGLRPGQAEPRIGELQARLAVGAIRSAAEVMGALVRRADNPFLAEFDASGRYRDRQEALRVRLDVQIVASESVGPQSRALYALLLFYTDEREEAEAVAAQIARDAPSSAYASWPAMMRAAANRSSAPSPRP